MAHSRQRRHVLSSEDAHCVLPSALLGVYASKQQQQQHSPIPANSSRSPHLPATVFLSDGERDASNPSRLVCDEDRERWVRAPPNCNPFDARASFSCSSMSCRAVGDATVQATYGRIRLNTATGVERPSCGGDGGDIGLHSTKRVCHSTDCRQHVDGCFSSRTRWSPSLDTNPDRNAFAHPVVYVPVRLDMCAKSPIHPTPQSESTVRPLVNGSPSHAPTPDLPLQKGAAEAELHCTAATSSTATYKMPPCCCTANEGHSDRGGASPSTVSSSSTSSHS
uniref:Uncharacterized protein n=1 Tax=Parascaris univalens TaxID=6257 RepID=A0A915B117_PARUN